MPPLEEPVAPLEGQRFLLEKGEARAWLDWESFQWPQADPGTAEGLDLEGVLGEVKVLSSLSSLECES